MVTRHVYAAHGTIGRNIFVILLVTKNSTNVKPVLIIEKSYNSKMKQSVMNPEAGFSRNLKIIIRFSYDLLKFVVNMS